MKSSTIKMLKFTRTLIVLSALALCTSALATDSKDLNTIRKINVNQKGNKTIVSVVGTEPPTYTAFKLVSPRRLIVDIANSQVKGVPSVIDAKTPIINGVAVSQFSSGKVPVSRVMVNFQQEAAYRVKVKGNNLIISMMTGPEKQKTKALVENQSNSDASEKIASAQAEAKKAQKQLSAAQQALEEIRQRNSKHQEQLILARQEAKKAKDSLKRAISTKKNSDDKRADEFSVLLGQAEKKASSRIAMLEKKIAVSKKHAAQEQTERRVLEERLESLQGELTLARKDVAKADGARVKAEQVAVAAKIEASELTVAARRAKKEAKLALVAQLTASNAYKRASENEKNKLLVVLKKRKKESVEAKGKLISAESSRKGAETALEEAIAQLKKTTSSAKNAQKIQTKLETQTERKLAAAKKQIKAAEKAARVASIRSEKAAKEKQAAQRDVDRIKAEAAAVANKANKRAGEQIAHAEQLVKSAEAAQRKAEKKTSRFEERLATAMSTMESAVKRAGKMKDKLADARAIIAEKETKLSLAHTQIEQQKKTIGVLISKNEAAEQQKQKIKAKPKGAIENKKGTQEQLRLKRLAILRGEKVEKPASKSDKASKLSTITNINFINRAGSQRIVINTDKEATFVKSKKGKKSVTLVFKKTALGPMLERTLDVSEFGGVLKKISSFKDGNVVKIEVETNGNVSQIVNNSDGEVEWIFSPTVVAQEKKKRRARATDSKTIIREDSSAYEYPMERTAAYESTAKKKTGKKRRYSGRRIDLDFKDADIHNILRLLSDVGHVNIITADDVKGSVTIRMRDVPWDQALDVILQAKHLGMIKEGNLIRVAPLSTLSKEREMEIARRKQNKALEPMETRLIPISYATAGEIKPRADDLLSDRGKLSVDSRTNVIIARDTASNLDQIEALIRNLDTQTPQVLIEGRIVEASSIYAREIGIQWGGDFSASSATANPTGLAFPSTIGVSGGATDTQTPVAGLSPVAGGRPNPNFAVNLPAAAGTGSGGALGITLGSISNNANLNLRLSAMEEEGTLRILSSPKILTLDNREAHIEQGTLIPYSRISSTGIQTAFKEAKLNLTVTPHVTADGSVLLSLKMTRDEPDFNNKGARGDPTILKREAQTELLVKDGHTAVIGGIFTRNHGTSYKKVPFFGDIPILGWLFKNRSDSDRRSEMLIFITPRIVNRAESIGQ